MAEAKHALQLERLAVCGGWLKRGAQITAVALFGVPFAMTCPFVWAAFVYWWLKSDQDSRRTIHELTGAPLGIVDVEGDAIEILTGGSTRLHTSEVIDGWIEPAGHETHVVVRLTRARRLVAATRTHEQAEQLLSALGVSLDRQAARFPLASRAVEDGQRTVLHVLGPWLLGLGSLGFGGMIAALPSSWTGRALGSAAFLLVLGLLVRGFWRYVARGTVLVGNDGFTVVRARRRHFYGYGDVQDVQMAGDVVVTTTRGKVRLGCATFVDTNPEVEVALGVRLQAALASYRARMAQQLSGLGMLDRGGRDVATWRSEVLALTDDRAEYRRARIDPGELIGVVEDAAASAERRLAAAMALSARPLEDGARSRLRFAARSCAHPGLRAALERSVTGEVELGDLEAALAEEEAEKKA